MMPVKRTVPSPSGNYLVMLQDYVDVPSFKNALPANIQSKITSEWSIVKAKGIAGTMYPCFSFFLSFITCPGPFDEVDRSFLSQHPDVQAQHIDEDGIVTKAARQSVIL